MPGIVEVGSRFSLCNEMINRLDWTRYKDTVCDMESNVRSLLHKDRMRENVDRYGE